MSTTAHGTSSAPRLRLTRRGRIVFGALIATPIAIVFALGAFSAPSAQAGDTASVSSSDAVAFDYITVAAGESLWDLAEWISPDSDPREVVAQITALNQLSASDVQPGQRLAIPTVYSH